MTTQFLQDIDIINIWLRCVMMVSPAGDVFVDGIAAAYYCN